LMIPQLAAGGARLTESRPARVAVGVLASPTAPR
jgi:hypothetical protein